MGYKVVYSEDPHKERTGREGSLRLRTLVALSMLVFALTVRLTWQDGTQKLREILIPGNLTVTEEAFSAMVTEIRSGTPVGQALHAFCSSVIDAES